MNQSHNTHGAASSSSRSAPPTAPPPTTPKFEPLISAEAAAELLDLHPVTLLRWAREGRIPHHRLGRRVVFRLSELDNWLNSGQPLVQPSGQPTQGGRRAA
jgi:excisionase family DNA binding protein